MQGEVEKGKLRMSFFRCLIGTPRRIGLMVLLLTLVFDQWTKDIVLFDLALSGRVIEVTSFFNLVLVWNYGVSFGFLASDQEHARWMLIGLTGAIVLVLAFLLSRAQDRFQGLAYGMVIGGAVGNIIDRIRFGAVADFLDFYVADYHWPAFNIADSGISVGVAMLLWDSIIRQKRNHKSV